MRRLTFGAVFAATLVSLAVAPALYAAQYTEIQNDAYDGVNDGSYVGGVMTWSSSDAAGAFNILTLLEDTGPVPGYTGNVVLTITSNFAAYTSTLTSPPRAYLTGGSMSLTFDYYTPDLSSMTSHELSGPISQGSIEVTSTSPTLSTLTGIFNFDTNAGVENLPSSNNWPATDESTAVALSFAFGANLDGFEWDSDLTPPSVNFDTQFSLFPEERAIPEPASLMLLALGGLPLLARRKRA